MVGGLLQNYRGDLQILDVKEVSTEERGGRSGYVPITGGGG